MIPRAEGARRSLAVLSKLIAGGNPPQSEYIIAPHVREDNLKEE